MLNKQSMMQDAQKFLGQGGAGKFGQLFDLASRIVNTCQNPKEELQKLGVNANTIKMAKGFINFPGVGSLINKYGNKELVLKDLDKLEKLFLSENQNSSVVEQAPANELEQLQANLAKLK